MHRRLSHTFYILYFGVQIFMEPSPKLRGQMLPFISKVGVKTTLMCIAVLKTGWQAVSAVKRSVSCCFNKYDLVKGRVRHFPNFSNCQISTRHWVAVLWSLFCWSDTGLNQAHSGADQIAWGIDDGKQQCLCNIHFTAKAISCVLHAPSLKELHNISISSPNFHT